MSNEDPNYVTGDLVFIVKELPHPLFTRVKNDLQLKITIDLIEALTNFTRNITHFDNHTVEIKNDGVIQPGTVKRIQYEGMPIHEAGSQRGDLIAQVIIKFPSILSQRKKEGKCNAFNIF